MRNNKDGLEDLEKKIVLYIRYLYLLDGHFKFEQYQKQYVLMKVQWLDSFNREKVFEQQSLKLEITGMLYNLVITYLKLGSIQLTLSAD